MKQAFNKLTPAEAERLDYLTEELGEVLQAIGKIKRHGYESFNPDNPNHQGNRFDLERELTDVLKAIWLLYTNKDINTLDTRKDLYFLFKNEDIKNKYFHHQERTSGE